MRILVAVTLALAVGVMPVEANEPPANQGMEAGSAISATYANLLYTPAKVVVAILGGVTGGVVGVLTGGSQRAAYAIWVPTMGGDYFVRPENFNGGPPVAFFGSDYVDRPSQASTANDSTYAYDALYDRAN